MNSKATIWDDAPLSDFPPDDHAELIRYVTDYGAALVLRSGGLVGSAAQQHMLAHRKQHGELPDYDFICVTSLSGVPARADAPNDEGQTSKDVLQLTRAFVERSDLTRFEFVVGVRRRDVRKDDVLAELIALVADWSAERGTRRIQDTRLATLEAAAQEADLAASVVHDFVWRLKRVTQVEADAAIWRIHNALRPALSESGSSAADVDGAAGSESGLHESVGERQGRQPDSLSAEAQSGKPDVRADPKPPRCRECGAESEMVQLKPIAECAENENSAEIRCANGHLVMAFQRPSRAAIDRGRELAEKYGWGITASERSEDAVSLPPLGTEAVLWCAALDLLPIEKRIEWVAAMKARVAEINNARARGSTLSEPGGTSEVVAGIAASESPVAPGSLSADITAIAERWTQGHDRGAHDYTDAGCRIMAEHAFRDINVLLAALSPFDEPPPHLDHARFLVEGGQASPPRLRTFVPPPVTQAQLDTAERKTTTFIVGKPTVPEGRKFRADGKYADCAGDCGEGGLFCCDGEWQATAHLFRPDGEAK